MEIRKLQHIKGGSFTLSLPKEWIEKQKLKRGEEIAVLEEEDGSLRLYPITMEHKEPMEVALSLEDFPEVKALEYCIGTYYIQGSNKISITSKKIIPVHVKKRLKLLRMDLPGVEVDEEMANALSFHAIIDPSAFLLESLIEKTSSFSLHILEDATKSIINSDFQLANEVIERSKEALRHYRMTIRQVALASFSRAISRKVGVKNCRECVTFALIARDLNRLVYHSSSVAMQFLALKDKLKINHDILSAIGDISSIVHNMQRDAVQAFLKKDVMLAIATMRKIDDVKQKEEKLLTTIQKNVEDADLAVALSHIARDLRRIGGYSVAIADDAMNRTLAPAP